MEADSKESVSVFCAMKTGGMTLIGLAAGWLFLVAVCTLPQAGPLILLRHFRVERHRDMWNYVCLLWLAYFEGFSYKEIGRILQKTTHNIETIAYRARQALKTILIMEGFDYENLS